MIVSILFAAAVATAPATVTPAPAPVAAPAVAAKPEKKICRSDGETGSLIGAKRVCLTKAEWAARDADDASDPRDVDALIDKHGLPAIPK